MMQQTELPLVECVTHPSRHPELPGVEVERLRDWWFDTEWWLTDDTLLPHPWLPRPHVE